MKNASRRFSFLVLLAGMLLFSEAALAHGFRGDMFANADWSSAKRPRVPSDDARGQDMFPDYPLMYNPDADLFDGVLPRVFYTGDDMLAPTHIPGPQGRLFSSWNDR